jgi:hypothetical protein
MAPSLGHHPPAPYDLQCCHLAGRVHATGGLIKQHHCSSSSSSSSGTMGRRFSARRRGSKRLQSAGCLPVQATLACKAHICWACIGMHPCLTQSAFVSPPAGIPTAEAVHISLQATAPAGLPRNATATGSLRRCPPDSSPARQGSFSASLTCAAQQQQRQSTAVRASTAAARQDSSN